MKTLRSSTLLALLLLTLASTLLGQEIPRTAAGKPDFTGFYNAATLTPLVRPAALGERMSLTDEEAAAIAQRKADLYAADAVPSDPNRSAPEKGGTPIFDPGLEIASGGSGGYNAFYMDPGDGAFKIDGEWRTSILIDPTNGQFPPMTPAAQQKQAAMAMFMRANIDTGSAFWIDDEIGPYDNMEQRPLAERCLLGFGSTAGPPMLPTLYNSMKRIVQNEDHVMILIEMQHDARVFRVGGEHASDDIKHWLGDSTARWEGDTLVVTTLNPRTRYGLFKTSDDVPAGMVVEERFSYLDADTLVYRFTVSDPETWTGSWTGEYVWLRSDDKVYEYACHEGNYAMGNIMRGARILEKDALAAKAEP
ncbi:MAG: hypothetical protein AAGK22_22425 [Acidobacteriota bacterium]